MWHKNAGRENAGKANTAQEILGWSLENARQVSMESEQTLFM